LFVLQTPLFRVRNKKTTLYCYDDTERDAAIKTLGRNPEITRFKGLGEISPDEFKHFIGDDIRLDPVKIDANESIKEMLKFFMGKNTPTRQEYIIRNLRFEHDLVDDAESESQDADDVNADVAKKADSKKEEVVESAAA
jgi:topoisomerase-4 subunit B